MDGSGGAVVQPQVLRVDGCPDDDCNGTYSIQPHKVVNGMARYLKNHSFYYLYRTTTGHWMITWFEVGLFCFSLAASCACTSVLAPSYLRSRPQLCVCSAAGHRRRQRRVPQRGAHRDAGASDPLGGRNHRCRVSVYGGLRARRGAVCGVVITPRHAAPALG